MKKILIAISLILTCAPIFAQDYEPDAAKMMRTDLTGTARSLGAGGAFSTVGADMSSMQLNPAGIALYRASEAAISAGSLWGNTNSTYYDNVNGTRLSSTSADFSKGVIQQAGFVFASRKLSRYDNLSYNRGGSKLDRVVFAIGYQKLADFNRTDYFYGTNSSNSYAQSLAADLNKNINNINLNNFQIPQVNAYQNYVVDYTDSTNSQLGSKIGTPVNQIGTVTTQGSVSEINMTLGFNIGNTIYIGGGIGIPYMSYHRYASFSESNAAGDSNYVSNYGYSYTGWGVNGKFGIIAKPFQWWRIGAAIQTPTMYRLHESDYGENQSNLGDSSYYTNNSTFYNFTYNNPLKATFGTSFYIKHFGFISADYELDDYSHTHYSFDGGYDASSVNNAISNSYKLASTVRVGAEYAYKTLRLRAGFAWSESPFNNNQTAAVSSGDKYNYTAGIGYRGRVFFADLAYVRTMYKDFYAPYYYQTGVTTQEPGVYNTFTSNMLIATIGFKFGRRD